MKLRKYVGLLLMATFVAGGTVFAEAQYPYVAQVIGDNVNIRAGAGVNHYRCGRISEPETVIVEGEQFGFSKIRPPKGSFSWIAKQYVDKKDDSSGEVIGDRVRVWAGSPYVAAIHSSSSQVELNRGEKVVFAGKDEGDYYKISPPEGAYLWINSGYLKKLGPLSKFVPSKDKDVPVEPLVAPVEKKIGDRTVIEGADIALDKPASEEIEQPEAETEQVDDEPVVVERQRTTKEMEAIDKYLEIAAEVQVEREKPLAVQDYTAIIEGLEAIIADKANGRAVNFAEALMDVVGRYQAAHLADKAITEQDAELVKIRSDIRKRLKQQVETIGITTGYKIIGTLSRSYVYTTESGEFRYAVRDEKDSITAYAIPADRVLRGQAERLVGKQVGLNGEIKPDPNTSRVLIIFDEIKEIWQPGESE